MRWTTTALAEWHPTPWAVLLLALASMAPAEASAYPCGNPSSGHCYGTATWVQDDEFFGASTEVTQAPLGCPAGCGGFVNNEIWLRDTRSQNCKSNRFKMCWVEAGSIASDGKDPVFFWADARPTTQNTFNLHLLGPVDPPGAVNHYMIVKDGRVTPNPFLVFIYNDSLSTLYNGVSAVESGPPMRATIISIGQELAGTANAYAGLTFFTRNIWATQALDASYTFYYYPHMTTGEVKSDRPPTAAWWTAPGTSDGCNPAPEGGRFSTICCQTGEDQ